MIDLKRLYDKMENNGNINTRFILCTCYFEVLMYVHYEETWHAARRRKRNG